MEFTDYKTIKAPLNQIDQFVNDQIAEGWSPIGQLVVLTNRDAIQPMARGEEQPPAILEYFTVVAPLDQVDRFVSDRISAGWQPSGELVVLTTRNAIQPMVLGMTGGGGGGGEITADDISDATAVGRSLIKAASAEAARNAIGAGTSSLAIGSGADSAAAGNHTHAEATASLSGLMSSDDKQKLDGVAAEATKNDSDSNLKSRANHTGEQGMDTISGLEAALADRATTASLNALIARVEALEAEPE